jgi:hypothetical protein
MAFDPIRRLLPMLVVVSMSATMHAQESLPSARTILDLAESEQIVFIQKTIELRFPENRADQMTMLIINRSAITLPMIEAKLEEALNSPPASKDLVETASEMIAYAGDEQALRSIGKLLAVDAGRFGPLVRRTLENASNWRNPFTVAYRGLEIGDEVVSRHVASWAASVVSTNRMQRAWAEAMLDRYGRVPDETEWTRDPIASRLKDRVAPDLRQSVIRFGMETQSKRQGK